jgi:four helix bundle protein
MRDFRELQVWRKSHEFVLDVYRGTSDFPPEERFGLTSQLRRAAVSVASNIAEGCGRGGERELGRYLNMAGGSASEVEYQLLLARDLGYLREDAHVQLDAQASEIKKMLNGFIKRLES